jgi:hypothetical protein
MTELKETYLHCCVTITIDRADLTCAWSVIDAGRQRATCLPVGAGQNVQRMHERYHQVGIGSPPYSLLCLSVLRTAGHNLCLVSPVAEGREELR